MSFRVIGTGSCLPRRVVTNRELSGFLDTSEEWISRRVGVEERRVCTWETTTDLALGAAQKAMEQSGATPDQLDLILCSTVSADDASPSLACMLQGMLGAGCPAMDLNAACSGFIYMLDTAAGFFARGKARKVLVVGAERMSRLIDWTDRNTAVIFGDGAGAMVLEAGEDYLASKLTATGGDTVIKIPQFWGMSPFYQREPQKPYLFMNGQETFKFAVQSMCRDLEEVIAQAGLRVEDIDWVIPHQANIRILEAAGKRLGLPDGRICSNIRRRGNTSSASIPILVDELNREGRLSRGQYLALCGFGGGLTSGACVLRWQVGMPGRFSPGGEQLKLHRRGSALPAIDFDDCETEVRTMVFEKLAAILAAHLGCEAGEIQRETTFESLGIDSLDTVEMVMKLEEELGVVIELEGGLKTVGELVDFIEGKL